MTITAYKTKIPERMIDVVEPGRRSRKEHVAFHLGRDLEFNTDALQSYAFARWEPVLYDAMVVAAAVEFADRLVKRPALGWGRRIELRIPVHEPTRWNDPAVFGALHDAVGFLTGDFWTFEFSKRVRPIPPPLQDCLPFPRPTEAVIAYSDGMDSQAVAGLIGRTLGDRLVRVRVGSKAAAKPMVDGRLEPFARVPYKFTRPIKNGEPSARSRGFKFTLISGLAAYLAEAEEILIPESGQGAIGPALVTVSHAHPDYRNHPLFTTKMARFLEALLGKRLRFGFPRLWHTKGETLRAFVDLQSSDSWRITKSCWRNSRWSALNGKLLQCGVCAACMLRRMSVHAAGLSEPAGTYICTDLSAATFGDAIHPDFKRRSPVFEQYAIAGTLHLDHMADMAAPDNRPAARRHAVLTGAALGVPPREVEKSLVGVFERHADEWRSFLGDLGKGSFVKKWTRACQ